MTYKCTHYRSAVVNDFSKEEIMVMAVAEIVSELLKAVRENRDVDLNK